MNILMSLWKLRPTTNDRTAQNNVLLGVAGIAGGVQVNAVLSAVNQNV